MLMSLYAYPMDAFEDVVPWFLETVKTLPRFVEPFLFGLRPPGSEDPLVILFGAAYADTEEEGRDALAAYERCPAIDRAVQRQFATPTTFPELYDFMAMGARPGRYAVDGMWTHDPPATIAPVIRELIITSPARRRRSSSCRGPTSRCPTPLSLQAPLYISAGCIWDDESDDERMCRVAG